MTRLVAALGAAALVAASGAAVASASPSPSPSSSVRLKLVERQVGEHFIDLGRHGLSPGDHNVVRSQILNTDGKVVGRGDIDCVVTGAHKQLGGLCHVVITLPDGQIAGEAAFGRSGSSRYGAIVGGTRRYAGMSGQTIVDTSGSDAHEPFTVELSR
jgi:hypothetical protein